MSVDMSKVHEPEHYVGGRSIQPWDAIRDWKLNFNLGSVVKYVSRAGRKENALEDLYKAKEYLNKEIECMETEAAEKKEAPEAKAYTWRPKEGRPFGNVGDGVALYVAFRRYVEDVQALAKKKEVSRLESAFKITVNVDSSADDIVLGITKSLNGIIGREEAYFDENFKGWV